MSCWPCWSAALAGWEDVNVPGTKGGLRVINRDDDRFFAEVDLSYYPSDNLRLSVGYNYENEASLGAAAFEYMPRWTGLPMSVFGTGNFGDDDHTRVTGGLKVYLAADCNKSLIRRHREDDPRSYNPVFPKIKTAAPAQPLPQGEETNFCPATGIFPKNDFPGCICPPDSQLAGQPPADANVIQMTATCDEV